MQTSTLNKSQNTPPLGTFGPFNQSATSVMEQKKNSPFE
jgi:hypothetical protein